MRKIGLVLVVLALAVGFGVPAEAGGKGAIAAGLYVGEYPDPAPGGGNSVLVYPLVRVGNVVFNPRAGGEVDVQITLRKGAPATPFEVFLVHTAEWGTVSQQNLSMTTDKHGHATLRFSATPDTDDNPVFVKAIVRVSREGPVYVTDEHYLNLKN
jgi:hypothetical protein